MRNRHRANRRAKITIGKVDASGVEPAQVEMAEIAGRKLAFLALGFALIELFEVALAQELVEGILVG